MLIISCIVKISLSNRHIIIYIDNIFNRLRLTLIGVLLILINVTQNKANHHSLEQYIELASLLLKVQ